MSSVVIGLPASTLVLHGFALHSTTPPFLSVTGTSPMGLSAAAEDVGVGTSHEEMYERRGSPRLTGGAFEAA